MELKERLSAQTPVWFKKIRKVAIRLTALATALLAAGVTIPGFTLPEIVNLICSWVIVGGICAGLTASTAKTDASV